MATCQQTVLWTPLNSLLSIGGGCRQQGSRLFWWLLSRIGGQGLSPQNLRCASRMARGGSSTCQTWKEVWARWATLILGDLLGGSPDSAHAVREARTGQVVQ